MIILIIINITICARASERSQLAGGEEMASVLGIRIFDISGAILHVCFITHYDLSDYNYYSLVIASL